MMQLNPSRIGSRIPVKIHRNVEVLVVEDSFLATELLNSPKISPYIALRLADTTLLIFPGKTEELIKALAQAGYPARVVNSKNVPSDR